MRTALSDFQTRFRTNETPSRRFCVLLMQTSQAVSCLHPYATISTLIGQRVERRAGHRLQMSQLIWGGVDLYEAGNR